MTEIRRLRQALDRTHKHTLGLEQQINHVIAPQARELAVLRRALTLEERDKEELASLREESRKAQESLSISALNETVMEEHLEKLKDENKEKNLLINKLKQEILKLHQDLANKDNKHKELQDVINMQEVKLKQARKANKDRERDILRLQRDLDIMQGLLSRQTARQLQRLESQ
jgi:hypothetical protein